MIQKLIKFITAFRRLWGTFDTYKGRAVGLMAALVLCSLLEAFGIALVLPILEIIIKGDSTSRLGSLVRRFTGDLPPETSLAVILAAFLVLIVLKNLFILYKERLSANFTFGLRNDWVKRIFRKYVTSDYNFILDSKLGTLINIILVETTRALTCLKFFVDFCSSSVLALFMLCVLLFTSWQATLAVFGVFWVVLSLVNGYIQRYSRRVGKKKVKYAREMSGTANEALLAIRQVKTFGMEGRILDGFDDVVDRFNRLVSTFKVFSEAPRCAGEVITFFLIVAALNFIMFFTDIELKTVAPVAGLFLVVGIKIVGQVSLLVKSAMNVLSHLDSLFLVYENVHADIRGEDLDSGEPFPGLSDDIRIEGLDFSYPGKQGVLQNVDMAFPKGKFVFIIGPSGSGKSTLVDLLLRLQEPNGGTIRVNGRPLSEFNLESWRRKVGFVSQDVFLFNTSIKENILIGKPDATDAEIIDAAKRVNAHDFIVNLENGYDTRVGDRGMKLSGGQRQRVVLARSLIRDPDLLIFDEATSSLDQELEAEIIASLKSTLAGRTVIFITHRLATAVHADLVYVLENGRVVRSGPYDKALAGHGETNGRGAIAAVSTREDRTGHEPA